MSRGIGIKIISVVLFLNTHAHAASNCADRLTSHPKIAARDFREYLKANGLRAPSDVVGLADWLKLRDLRPTQVVLINLTKFFGDNVIFGFSTIDYLRQTFDAPFLYVSPVAEALNGVASDHFARAAWPITFAQHRTREARVAEIMRMKRRFESFLEQHVRPGALVLYDLTTLDKADQELATVDPRELSASDEFRCALARRDVTAIGLGALKNERIHLGITGLDVLARPALIPAELRFAHGPHVKVKTVEGLTHVQLRGVWSAGQTTYEAWLRSLNVVFGQDAFMSWDANLYVRPEHVVELDRLKHRAGLAIDRPHAFLNLNTFGADKVRDLTPVYTATLDRVVAHVLSRYPELDLLVRFPEHQFGPEVQSHALALAARTRGRVAMIPLTAQHLLGAIYQSARWIVSYDSGPFHQAAFRPADLVLSVSLWSGSGDVWRKPGQKFIKITDPRKSNRLGDLIVRAIDRDLEPAARR